MVKTFIAQSPSTLEDEINSWINANDITIKQIQYQAFNNENYQFFTAMLLYEEI